MIPSCSTCGLAVEWLRSCYQSEWHLFSDNPGLKTPGRYYFSADNTPFVEGVHNLGSREWNDANWQHVQALGEDLTSRQVWDGGQLPALVPSNIQLGQPWCLQNGEIFLEAIPGNTLIAGFPPGCFVAGPQASKPFGSASAYDSCSIQLAACAIINWSYDQLEPAIRAFLEPFLGPAWTVRYVPPTPTLPAITSAISPAGTLVWVDGTANYQQFALQAAYSLQQPQNLGGFSSSTFWRAASAHIHATIDAQGASAIAPVFLCGHSYGGIACLLLAVVYRMAQPERTIKFLTFGCPHVGDVRTVNLIAQCDGLNIANDSDVVTAIPFDGDLIYELATFFVLPALLGWLNWKAAPRRTLMDEFGVLHPDQQPILDWPTLVGFVGDIVAALPYPDVEAHRMPTYFKRTFNRCQLPEWPLTANDYARLLAGFIIGTEAGDEIITEDGKEIAYEI